MLKIKLNKFWKKLRSVDCCDLIPISLVIHEKEEIMEKVKIYLRISFIILMEAIKGDFLLSPTLAIRDARILMTGRKLNLGEDI